MRHGEGLNLRISEESAQLDILCPTGFEISALIKQQPALGGIGFISSQLTLKVLGNRPVRIRMQGGVEVGGERPRLSGYELFRTYERYSSTCMAFTMKTSISFIGFCIKYYINSYT